MIRLIRNGCCFKWGLLVLIDSWWPTYDGIASVFRSGSILELARVLEDSWVNL